MTEDRAAPIPVTVEVRHGGIEIAQCAQGDGRIFRSNNENPLPWIHADTGRVLCFGAR
jgi:uncharacterized Fe-S cluster protein YjdI